MKKDWEIKEIGEVCQKTSNITWSKFPNRSFEYIDLSSVSRETFSVTESSTVNQDNAPSRAKQVVKIDDVIFGTTRPTLMRVARISENHNEQLCSTGFCVLRPNKDLILPQYIFYFLQTDFFKDRMHKLQRGASYPAVSDSDVKNTNIPVPPISEQKRIVKILDEKFEAIEKLKKVTEKQILETEELFLSSVYEALTKDTQNWNTDLLKNCFRLKSGDNLTTRNIVAGETPVYGGNGVMGYHNDSNLTGDNVIVGRVGALCGIARNVVGDIWLTDNAFKVIDHKYDFNNVFLAYLLNFVNLRKYASEMAQPVISNTSLKDIRLSFPKLSDQKKIAEKLDASRKKTEDLRKLLEDKLKDVQELKKSYLEQAFAGKL